jgi:hypothetical protein
MGSRNPDRVPIAYRRRRCESVGDMIRQGWDVHSKCQGCQHLFRVNLKMIARVKGADFSLWNRRERCKRLGCTGFMVFQGKTPDMSWHEPLDAPWPEGKAPAAKPGEP